MSKKFLTPINLTNLSSDPATGSEGDLYFNTTDNVVKIYVDGIWTELQGGAGGGGASVIYQPEQPDVTGLEVGTVWVDSNAEVTGGGGGSGTGGPSFQTIVTSPTTQSIVAATAGETLTLISGENISIVNASANNSVTINSTGNYTSVDSIQYPDYIVFDTTPENTSASVSTLAWDSGESSLSLQLNANTNVTLGQELIVKVYNAEASTITKGQAVYLFGAQGQRPSVKLASNASDTTSAKTFGIAAENITSGAEGLIVSQGLVKNINTNGFNEGDVLWLGNTPGSLTTTKPQGPLHGVFVGVVLKKNSSSGRIYVKAQNGYELDELHDVRINSRQDGDLIIYNSASSIWINSPKQDIINTASAAAVSYLPSASATLTNKTINLSNNTISGTVAQFNTALSDGNFATLSGYEALTNKDLMSSNRMFGAYEVIGGSDTSQGEFGPANFSTPFHYITGSTPGAIFTLVNSNTGNLGQYFKVLNASTVDVTVKSSSGNILNILKPNQVCRYTVTSSSYAAGVIDGWSIANDEFIGNLEISNKLTNKHALTIETDQSSDAGGSGYASLIKLNNLNAGATNSKKHIRLNSTGTLEIINNAYNASIFQLTDSGNLTLGGSITPQAFTEGQIIKTTIWNNSDMGFTSNYTNNTITMNTIASKTYTPASNNSRIFFEVYARYEVSGTSQDSFYSQLTWNNIEIGVQRELWTGQVGGGSRSSKLFPILGQVVNSSLTGYTFAVKARQDSADDTLTVFAENNSFFVKITEVSR